jgi:hypothetical protein
MGFVWFSLQTAIISLNNINQLIYVMVKRGALFEVRSEFLDSIYISFCFKGLIPCRLWSSELQSLVILWNVGNYRVYKTTRWHSRQDNIHSCTNLLKAAHMA